MFITLPIIGSGTRDNAYRIDLPAILAFSAHIPTARNGVPIFLDALAWLDDNTVVPANLTSKLKSESTARGLLLQRDSACSLEALKRPPQVRDVRAALGVTLAEETFAGSDSTDIGTSWEPGYPGGVNLQRVGNRARSTATFTDAVERYSGATFPNDQWSGLTIATFQGLQACVAHLTLRMAAPPTFTMYECIATINWPSTSMIRKWVSGALTDLSSENATTWAASNQVYLETVGTTLRLYRNGNATPLLTAVDSSIASGWAGLCISTDVIADTEVSYWNAGAFPQQPMLLPGGSRYMKTGR